MAAKKENHPIVAKPEAEHEEHYSKRILAGIHEIKSLIAGIKREPQEKQGNGALENKRNRRPNWMIFWVTFAYCIFAGLQWNTMGKQLDEVQLEQRPWMKFSVQDPLLPEIGKVINVGWEISNIGNTPAVDVHAELSSTIHKVGTKPSFEPFHPVIITSGSMFPKEPEKSAYTVIDPDLPAGANGKPMSKIFTPDMWRDMTDGKIAILTYGTITYHDTLGNYH